MTTTNNLDIDHLASNLTSPEPIINEQLDKVDAAIAGRLTINLTTDADYTLADPSGSTPAEWSYPDITFTDTGEVLTTGRAIIMPSGKGIKWRVANDTAQELTFKVSGGTGVAVAAGGEAFVYYDGSDIAELSSGGGALDDLSDVDTTGVADGDALTYDSGTGTWVPGAGGGGTSLPVDDTTALVRDPADNTKRVGIDAGAVATGTTRVLSMPDRDIDLTGYVPAVQASDTLTWHTGHVQAFTGTETRTLLSITGAVDLLVGTVVGPVGALTITVDGTALPQSGAGAGKDLSGDQTGAESIPAIRAHSSLLIELTNNSSNPHTYGWKILTR